MQKVVTCLVPLRSSIYTKGLEIYRRGGVAIDVETEKSVYLFVEGEHQKYDVRLMSDDTFNCTCRLGSLKAGKGVLCSHVIASILFMSERQPAEKRGAGVKSESSAD